MSETSQQSDHLSLQAGYLIGEVVHHRFSPKEHRFTNRMYWHLVDVNDLELWSSQSLFRSHKGFNVYGFKDRDYVSTDEKSIEAKIKDYLKAQSGEQFTGRILLMSHPRFINIGFNSVNFYFCYGQDELKFIVSEINNTPWGEKQLYFHDCRDQKRNNTSNQYDFSFDKCFHISPFVSMDIHYQWRFIVSAAGVDVHMKLSKNDENIMYVGLQTKQLTSQQKWGLPLTFRRPAQAWKMWLNIYLQAARLWLKRVPFHNHPSS